ncbi:hypothetical protein HYALB_00006908 [Hymenoscyphus albidus]|uniref:Uncharacterized protein n=1 Tax=Hymenoscyphus albidus TaxID=595503 RepID=A0A9N9Q8J4_9HELO|nr:hypothetical protein HYALB_00006908 [Hymenoscyphus albidus]
MSAKIILWLAFALIHRTVSQEPDPIYTTTVHNNTTASIKIWWKSDNPGTIGWTRKGSGVYGNWYCPKSSTYFVVVENSTLTRGQCARTASLASVTSLDANPCIDTSRTNWPTPCPSNKRCYSIDIQDKEGFARESVIYYGCDFDGSEAEAYRDEPASAAAESTTTSSLSTTTSPPFLIPTPASSAIPPPTSLAPSPLPEATSVPPSSKQRANILTQGEIAGIVVGSLTVIVGIIAWLCPHPAMLKRGVKYWLAGRFQKKKHEDIDELPLNRLNRLNRTRTF